MKLLAIVLALLIEQVRPLAVARWVHAPLRSVADACSHRFYAGRTGSAAFVWLACVGSMTLATLVLNGVLGAVHPVLAVLFNLLVLYLTLGFRHESHYFTDIHLALGMGELDRARQLLGQWRGESYPDATDDEVARLAVEEALLAAHRNVFGVIFWFVVLPGPAGAVMYRCADFLVRRWRTTLSSVEHAALDRFSRRAFALIDWAPARLTGITFAIVGNFEDAILCWRTQAAKWADSSSGIVLASGGGALGLRLGLPIRQSGQLVERPELGAGEDVRVESMQGVIGLLWRALLMCVLVLTLMYVVVWVAP
ncbi:CobD/CbiB family protein [Denitromonas iodatirespirans]|uniref:Cobalamin biosynthesis protein CobD n=1 Tax=Denitromonas iodatirespirans TaxID=2795389 RepID=A0A944D6Q0_DENI1|nr:CobD/CbiB family protein [Denitromonas iodatirespirans]MBT0960845.1 CobD/CbiB family protein [Denitromonas iodatirespirans]